jgi:hypothetical protein
MDLTKTRAMWRAEDVATQTGGPMTQDDPDSVERFPGENFTVLAKLKIHSSSVFEKKREILSHQIERIHVFMERDVPMNIFRSCRRALAG